MPEPYNIFQGNDVFLSGGQPVMPANAIAEKLRSGNFGPFPNQSAPPGFVLPPTMDPGKIASALRSNILPNIGGARPPGTGSPANGPAGGVPEGFAFNPASGTFDPNPFGDTAGWMRFMQTPAGYQWALARNTGMGGFGPGGHAGSGPSASGVGMGVAAGGVAGVGPGYDAGY